MKVIRNKGDMASCYNCLDRAVWAEVIISIKGLSINLCSNCRKELMKKLVDEF